MKHVFFLLAACALLCGCVTPATQQRAARMARFDESDYALYAAKGSGRILGQAFLKTRGGDVKVGAGCLVALNPVTPYSTEFYRRSVLNGELLESGDERARKYNRTVIADATGSFEFSELPAGDYYLHCEIRWEVPTAYGLTPTGGVAFATVHVDDGATVKAIVTR